MAQHFSLHPDNPQVRLIRQTVSILQSGGIMVYPTDTCYALGCRVTDKAAVGRIRAIRSLDERHLFTLMCKDLAQMAEYAKIDNRQFRLIKANTPGPYTFILPTTRNVPNFLQMRRPAVGLRISEHPVDQILLQELGEPILTTTLRMPDEEAPLNDPEDILARLGKQVDVVLDVGMLGTGQSTVLDLTGADPFLLREGVGAIQPFGF